MLELHKGLTVQLSGFLALLIVQHCSLLPCVPEAQCHLFHLCFGLLQLDYSFAGCLVSDLVTGPVHQHKTAEGKMFCVTDRHYPVQQHQSAEDKIILSVTKSHYPVQHHELAEDTTILYVTNWPPVFVTGAAEHTG